MTPSTSKCKAADPVSCRFHGKPSHQSQAEKDHLAKEAFYGVAFKASTDNDSLFSKDNTDRQDFLEKRVWRFGTEEAWEVSPEGYTGLHCKCGAYFTREQLDTMNNRGHVPCKVCNEKFYSPDQCDEVHLAHSSFRYTDPENIYKDTWYHITTDSNWDKSISHQSDLPMVHLGTKEAALDRKIQIDDSVHVDDKFYLFEVKMKRTSDVYENIRGDGNAYQAKKSSQQQPECRGKIVRYVNGWEDPGSVSLEVDYSMFEITSKNEIPRWEED